ncbi:MAG: branched-chain amino acid ABC transporter ATP-binding protein [Rhizobiales bacterium 62-17]|nr:ABC transporter ATP-binding protein [Hyphomicrobiales bacterium]OJY03532.1 MAG: branched-chain amino acid ABC transporter ATP-binding protein [Rhizobiales bacterium 62-17]
MLKADAVCVGYGEALALSNISFDLGPGELVAIIGPNGAGKTTLVNALARLLPIRSGGILLDGENIARLTPQQLADRGVAIIPEGRRLFTSMTVEENLELGCYRAAARAHKREGLEQAYAMFPILGERRRQISGTLSGGQQQMVAFARALMARPRLLLIDEPSLGLAPVIIKQVFETIARIHATGVSILLIEQNATKALEAAQRAYVLDCGQMIASGTPDELRQRPEIGAAYLGHGH